MERGYIYTENGSRNCVSSVSLNFGHEEEKVRPYQLNSSLLFYFDFSLSIFRAKIKLTSSSSFVYISHGSRTFPSTSLTYFHSFHRALTKRI